MDSEYFEEVEFHWVRFSKHTIVIKNNSFQQIKNYNRIHISVLDRLLIVNCLNYFLYEYNFF